MSNGTLVLLGSARKNGNTAKAVSFHFGSAQCIDFLDYNIEPYIYERSNRRKDNFIQTVETILQHEEIVFATPVYWYAMSGLMKTFFDKLTELITTDKALGRALAGKMCSLLACGTDAFLPEGFETPFRLTAKYFEMKFLNLLYVQTED